jgi:glycerol kinase
METDLGQKIGTLKVDGGVTKSNFIMQQQANLLEVPIERPDMVELTALGAAIAAGLGAKLWPSISDIPLGQDIKPKTFVPSISQQEAHQKYKQWLKVLHQELKN